MTQDDLDLRAFAEPVWFRVEAIRGRLETREFTVIKHTPAGAWLKMFGGDKKFVLRDIQHRARAFAAPTQDQARQDFLKRKQFRLRMLKQQISATEQDIELLFRERLTWP